MPSGESAPAGSTHSMQDRVKTTQRGSCKVPGSYRQQLPCRDVLGMHDFWRQVQTTRSALTAARQLCCHDWRACGQRASSDGASDTRTWSSRLVLQTVRAGCPHAPCGLPDSLCEGCQALTQPLQKGIWRRWRQDCSCRCVTINIAPRSRRRLRPGCRGPPSLLLGHVGPRGALAGRPHNNSSMPSIMAALLSEC